jgi:hypothetical protein
MGDRFFKLSLEFLSAEIDHGNIVAGHEVKELMAIDAQEIGSFTLGKTMLAKEFHDERFSRFGGYFIFPKLHKKLVWEFQIHLESFRHRIPPFLCNFETGISRFIE